MADKKIYNSIAEALKDRADKETNAPCSTMGGIKSITLSNNIHTDFNNSQSFTYNDYQIYLNNDNIRKLIRNSAEGKVSKQLEIEDMACILALADDETICKLTNTFVDHTNELIKRNQDFINKNNTSDINMGHFESTAEKLSSFIDCLNVITENAEISFESKAVETNKTTESLFDKLRGHVISKKEQTKEDNESNKEITDENQLPEDETPEDDSMDDDGPEMVREITRD